MGIMDSKPANGIGPSTSQSNLLMWQLLVDRRGIRLVAQEAGTFIG